MLTVGPQQILKLEKLVDAGDFSLESFKQAMKNAPPAPLKMTPPEKYAKLLKIFGAIKDQGALNVRDGGNIGGPVSATVYETIRNAFFDSGLKTENVPAFRDLYITYIIEKLNKATFGNAKDAPPKRAKFLAPLNELLDILKIENADADLVILGEAIRKSGSTNIGEETIDKKIKELKEKFEKLALQRAAAQDPILGAKIVEYNAMNEEFIRLHAQLHDELEDGMPEDQLATRLEHKRLQEIEELSDKVAKEEAKTEDLSKTYTKFLVAEEGKRTSALSLLYKERDMLLDNDRGFSAKLENIDQEDYAQITNLRAYKESIREELALLQVKIDHLEHGQEEDRAAADEIYIFGKLSALWLADEKTEGKNKPNHVWKDAFQAEYKLMTGQELSDEEFLNMKDALRRYNHELHAIVEDPGFRDKSAQEKYQAVSDVNQKYQRIIGGPFTQNLLSMGIRKFGELEVGYGKDAGNIPKLKSAKYLQAKIDILKQEQHKAGALANALGKHKIKLVTQQNDNNRVNVGRINNEKGSLIGLVVKGMGEDKTPYFVLPDNVNKSTLDTLKVTHKFATETEQKTRVGMAEYTPLIEMLSEDQIMRLAYFMGPDFARTFNVRNADHVDELKSELKAKLGNSSLAMGDLLLVALGYRFREPDFLKELNELKRRGFVFNAEFVNKGTDFFADEVTLKQDDKFEGEKLEPQKRQAVSKRELGDGKVIAKLNSRDAQVELGRFIEEILPKINQAERALEGLLEAAEGAILDVDYVKHFTKCKDLQNLVPREHPQSSLIAFLMTNPDVYSPEGKQQLAMHFAGSVAKQYEIQMLNQTFDKLLADIQQATDAKIEARRILEEQANADEEREREIAEIRARIKTIMMGDVGADEDVHQELMLNQFALMEYERLHGGPRQTVAQRVEAQVGNLGAQIQQIQQRIEVVRVVGNEQDLNLLREELGALRADKERLELELAALRNLQQQRLEVAQLTPEDAYKQSHKVDDMLRQAALQHTPKLEWTDVSKWIKNAEKGNLRMGAILKEAQEKVTTYNSNPEERRNKYGW
ncbi:MAG: hypothetical protein AB7D28_07935 [Candidatus Berkiella sp.]